MAGAQWPIPQAESWHFPVWNASKFGHPSFKFAKNAYVCAPLKIIKMNSTLNTRHVSSMEAMELEDRYGAHNYHPLPVVLSKGEGVYLGHRPLVICQTSSIS